MTIMEQNPLRSEVKAFAENMEKILKSKDAEHPRGWESDTLEDLFCEVERHATGLLYAVIVSKNNEMIIKKATDVANFAMMIANKAGLK